jgi:hypothetical protein
MFFIELCQIFPKGEFKISKFINFLFYVTNELFILVYSQKVHL